MNTEHRDLIPVIVEREQATLPDGFDSWGIKSVHPDLYTTHGYRWPFPGQIASCDPSRIITSNEDACPQQEGDGLCVGLTWQAMASGGIPARTLLLVAYRSADVLGHDMDEGKLRVPDVAVVALVDGQRLLKEEGRDADLRDANLRGANLRGADLRRADLQYANLRGADMRHANLQDADLRDANLRHANLQDANLQDANLRGANLQDANLQYANLRDANLQYANLWDANLWCANLQDANLQYADLRDANLRYANLRGANLQDANLRHANLQDANLALPNGWRLDDTGRAIPDQR